MINPYDHIINGNQFMRKLISDCQICKRLRDKLFDQPHLSLWKWNWKWKSRMDWSVANMKDGLELA